jgi:hypothetical protein
VLRVFVFVAAPFAPVLFFVVLFFVVRVGIVSLLYLSDAVDAFIPRMISSLHIHVGPTSSAIIPRGQRPAICNRLNGISRGFAAVCAFFLAQHSAVEKLFASAHT